MEDGSLLVWCFMIFLFPLIIFSFVHHVYIYTRERERERERVCVCVCLCVTMPLCVCVFYMYLLELQRVKGCKALRHRFPFHGIESFTNSFSLSLCVVASDCRLFLSLSLLFFLLLLVVSIFLQSPSGKREMEVTYYI